MAIPDQQFIADDPDTVKYTEFNGLRNNVNAERFEPGDLVVANNVDIDKSGQLSRRQGYTEVLAGSYHSLWSDNEQCLVVEGGSLHKLSAAYAATAIRVMSSASARVSYTKVNDRVYFSNGVDTGIVEGGVARSWGVVAPSLPGVRVTVGSMPAGTYQFSMTYVRNDGQESGASLAGRVDVSDGGGLILTLPVSSDATVVSKNFYLSTPNGEVLYLALQVPNSTVGTSYANSTQELSLPLVTQFLSPPPAGHLTTYYRGRMFVAVGDAIYPSEPFAYELFDLRKGIYLDGRITLMAAFEDKDTGQSGFFVGTDKNCGTLSGADEFSYLSRTDYGAIEGAVAHVDGALFGDGSAKTGSLPVWLTTQGVCVGMPQMDIVNLTRSRYQFVATGRGAGTFIPGANRLILTAGL